VLVPAARRVRIVVTFQEYNACKAWENVSLSSSSHLCASQVKCYGRRLVLDASSCEQYEEANLLESFSGILQVEPDAEVVAGEEMRSSLIVYADAGTFDDAAHAVYANILDSAYEEAYGMSTDAVYSADRNVTYENPFAMDQWNLDLLHMEERWNHSGLGRGHVVAVLDSGVALSAARAFEWLLHDGYDFISDPEISLDGDGRDPYHYDPGDRKTGECETSSWHGTYVTSVLAASRNANFSGVAPESLVLPVRVLGKCKMGYASDVADAIAWSVGANIEGLKRNDKYPAKTLVMAFTGKGPCPSYLQSVVTLARDVFNATLYAAAGNNASDASKNFPANCEGVISVGALDIEGKITDYSATNATEYMPGGTWANPVPCLGPNIKVGGCVGTSMAVPHAAGLRAVLNTEEDWVDPANLPTPLTAEQLALNYLPHATYSVKDKVQAANTGCLAPSVLYADGFCGMRMNTSSDLRSIWQVGYPLVELQPGTYTDATRHCNLAANVNSALKFNATHLFAQVPNTVVVNCRPFMVGSNFDMAITNIQLSNAAGTACGSSGATLRLNNITFSGGSSGATMLSVSGSCAIVLRGFLVFNSMSVAQKVSTCISFNNVDVARSDVGGELISLDSSWEIGSSLFINIAFSSVPAAEWIWTTKVVRLTAGCYAGQKIQLSRAKVSMPTLISTNLDNIGTCGDIILSTNSLLRFTDTFRRVTATSGYYYQRGVMGTVDSTSTLIFDATMKEFSLLNHINSLTVNGGRVLVLCNNAYIWNNKFSVFGLYNGAYMEWSGNNSQFVQNSAVIFSLATGSVFNLTGNGHVFSKDTMPIVANSYSRVYLSGSNIAFINNTAIGTSGAGAISVSQGAFLYMSGNSATFQGNYAGSNGSCISVQDGVIMASMTSATFERNSAGNSGSVLYFAGTLSNSLQSSFSCTDCSFRDNAAGNRGGVIYTDKFSPLVGLTNCSFAGNCAASASSKHAISMGYFPSPNKSDNVTGSSRLVIGGPLTYFSRTMATCPWIDASWEFSIQDGANITAERANDIVAPGVSENCSAGYPCALANFYSGPYRAEEQAVATLNNTTNLGSIVTVGTLDAFGRSRDASLYMLQPGIYTLGACSVTFTASSVFSTVTLLGTGASPSDTVINCSSTTFATVGTGFNLNLTNLVLLERVSTRSLASVACNFGLEQGFTTCAPCPTVIVDLPYSSMSFSSVSGTNTFGKLDSATAWTPATSNANQWMQFDLSQPVAVVGVATQRRGDATAQWVTKYRVNYSLSNVITWENNQNQEFDGNYELSSTLLVRSRLPGAVLAQFVRINPTAWNGVAVSMRAGVAVCLSPKATSAVHAISNEYRHIRFSSVLVNTAPGVGWGRGKLDSTTGWIPATQDTLQWMDMDLQYVGLVAGVVTQGRGDGTNSWVTKFRVSASIDCVTYIFVQGSQEFNANVDRDTRATNLFSPAVSAQCVRIHPTSWSGGSIAMRAATLAHVDTALPSMQCPPGHGLLESGSSCRSCPAGYYAEPSSSACTACAPGSYSAATASTQCTPCPAGSFVSAPGSANCTACPGGSFSSSVGSTACTACPAGMTSSEPIVSG
jgi:hypothetical protein